jgi:hypothetical protein
MTIPFIQPEPILIHRERTTRRDDPEPRVSELLDDPVAQMLMAVDGVARTDVETLIRRIRRQRGLRSPFEAELFAECGA